MLQFQEVLPIYKIKFWCELTVAIIFSENVELCLCQKYTLMSRLGGGGQDLDVGSMLRIDVG